MKSKKIVALALTAAIAISAASMTAFAKEVTYNTETTKKNPEELVATVTLTDDDLKEEKTITGYKAKEEVKADDCGLDASAGETITVDKYNALTGAKDKFEAVEETVKYTTLNDIGLKNYERTITKQQFGWEFGSAYADGTTWATDKDPKDKGNVIDGDKHLYVATLAADSSQPNVTVASGTYTLTFVTVGRTDTSDDNIAKNKEAIDAAASDAKKAADRDAQLAKLDAENGAIDNVNTGKGVETKKAEVSDPVAAADVADVHDLKVAGLDANLNNLAWVYEVQKPAGLINGKTARAQLKLPSGYTTSGYKVTVYHIKGWCSAEKVKGVNVGTNDVAFWANDFSPYVLVLTPKDAVAGTSTGNPSTGDFSAVPVAMLAAAALGATGFVAYKKRKAE